MISRNVDTLRVSVTDRCNLRCVYCMPPQGVDLLPPGEILSFHEMARVAEAAACCGVSTLRITGGEPLVRRGLPALVEMLAAVPGIQDLPLTTNGVLLARNAKDLKKAGLSRVTVSLDTLRKDRYLAITGRDSLSQVLAGLEAAREAGLTPLKINTVMVPGVNDDEALDFVRLAESLEVEVRFIERMPLKGRAGSSSRCGLESDSYVPAKELRERIEQELGPLKPLEKKRPGQPARVFELPSGKARVGFISPMSEPFCASCTRMRLTPEGKLRACLAENIEVDVKGPLRAGASREELAELFARAVRMKPEKDAACFPEAGKFMSQLGG